MRGQTNYLEVGGAKECTITTHFKQNLKQFHIFSIQFKTFIFAKSQKVQNS